MNSITLRTFCSGSDPTRQVAFKLPNVALVASLLLLRRVVHIYHSPFCLLEDSTTPVTVLLEDSTTPVTVLLEDSTTPVTVFLEDSTTPVTVLLEDSTTPVTVLLEDSTTPVTVLLEDSTTPVTVLAMHLNHQIISIQK